MPLIASDCLPHQAAESQLNELRSLLAVKGDVTQEREQLTRMRERAQDEAEERRRAESELTNKLTNTQLALERATSASTQAREQLEVLQRLAVDQLAHGEPLATEHVHEALGIKELLDEPEEHSRVVHARELVAHPKGWRDAAHELIVRRASA